MLTVSRFTIYFYIVCSKVVSPSLSVTMPPIRDKLELQAHTDELIAAGTAVLLERMRPSRKVQFKPQEYTSPSLPPPPRPLAIDPVWPSSFQSSIDKALDNAWADSTIKNYTHSINTFLAFCKKHRIPEELTFPSSDYLICSFIASQQETVSSSTIKNYISGIRAWHIRNGYTFTRSDRLNLLTRASRPLANKKPLRPPVSFEMLLALYDGLNHKDPFDACVFACATCAFWGLARLGELLPAAFNFKRDPTPFPSPTSITQGDQNSLKLHLPWTKVKKWTGEYIFLTIQDDKSDPVQALQRHLSVNLVPDNTILFSYKDIYGQTALLKQDFMNRCNEIWLACGLATTTGHSFRIGGTSHLLLSGVHPDIIKQSGRWSSDSFLRYWRNLDTVIPSHTSRLSKKKASGPSGEPRPGPGCGL